MTQQEGRQDAAPLVSPSVSACFGSRFSAQMRAFRLVLAVALAVAFASIAVAGCGSSQSISDSKIISALNLKQTARGYEIGGDPFCTVDGLLNDSDAVEKASKRKGAVDFLIASPHGTVGILARRPFAHDCAKRAQTNLRKLARKAD
jgi:hypothetical protein